MNDNIVQQIMSNSPFYLLKAQEEMEQAIQAYGTACDVMADAFMAYRQAKADRTRHYKEQGLPVSVIADYVQGDTAELKRDLLKAEGQRKMIDKHITAFQYRIDSMKKITQGGENLLKRS